MKADEDKLDSSGCGESSQVTGEEIVRFFDRNLDTLRTVLSSAESCEDPQDRREGKDQSPDKAEVFF